MYKFKPSLVVVVLLLKVIPSASFLSRENWNENLGIRRVRNKCKQNILTISELLM